MYLDATTVVGDWQLKSTLDLDLDTQFCNCVALETLEQFNHYHFTNLVMLQAVLNYKNTYLKQICEDIESTLVNVIVNTRKENSEKCDVTKLFVTSQWRRAYISLGYEK